MGRREEKRACMYTIATEESDGERRHQTRDAAAAPPQDGGRETEEGIKLVESPAPAFPWIVAVDAAGCVCLGVPLLLFLAAMLAGEKAEAMRREACPGGWWWYSVEEEEDGEAASWARGVGVEEETAGLEWTGPAVRPPALPVPTFQAHAHGPLVLFFTEKNDD